METDKFDKILGKICKEVVSIEFFFDAVFGYLSRCTDFFTVSEAIKEDEAKETTLRVFEKWKKLAREREKQEEEELCERLQSDGVAPAAVTEVEINSEDPAGDSLVSEAGEVVSAASQSVHLKSRAAPPDSSRVRPPSSDSEDGRYYAEDSKCYNGAIRENYCWAQSITDLDIIVPVPHNVAKGKHVHMAVAATSLDVSVLDGSEWKTLVSGDLCWRVNHTQTLWSLEPTKQIQIHLEKTVEGWWDAILITEPKIDLTAIDASRRLEDLDDGVEMKLQEMVWNERRKKEGLPTSDQLAHAKILKEAWNLEGSPFAGTPYDPSVLCASTNTLQLAK